MIVGNIQGEVWLVPNESHDGQLVFGAKQALRAGGKPIHVEGDAGPLVADWDGDGVPDLLVGQFGEGKLRIYKNVGTASAPRFDSFTWLKAGDKEARIPSG